MHFDASGDGKHVYSPSQPGSHRADTLQLAMDERDRLRTGFPADGVFHGDGLRMARGPSP
jgi:hypothetical protein